MKIPYTKSDYEAVKAGMSQLKRKIDAHAVDHHTWGVCGWFRDYALRNTTADAGLARSVLEAIISTWPNHSGNPSYPVTVPNTSIHPASLFHDSTHAEFWYYGQYAHARQSLVDWIITETDKVIRNEALELRTDYTVTHTTDSPKPIIEPSNTRCVFMVGEAYQTSRGGTRTVIATGAIGDNPIVTISGDGEVSLYDLDGNGKDDQLLHTQRVAAGLVLDQAVWVRDGSDANWLPRHYAGKVRSDGQIETWAGGYTSHTVPPGEDANQKLVWAQFAITNPNAPQEV